MRKVFMKALSCAALALSLCASARAQQSAFEDAKGESSVFIKDGGGFTRINATDKSIEFGYVRDRGDERPWFGVDVKGKASGDFASLFSGRTPSPEATVGLTLGKRFLFSPSHFAIIEKCQKDVTAQLQSDMPKLTAGAEKEFVAGFKKQRVGEIRKELTGRLEELKSTVAEEARKKGLSDIAARGLAASITPEYVEDEAERQADAEAKQKLVEMRQDASNITALTDAKALADATALCAEEDPAFARRRTLDWLAFRVSYSRARYKILNEDAAFADQVRKQNFDGYSATLAYNTLLTLGDVGAQKKLRKARRDARLNHTEPPKESSKGTDGSLIIGVSFGVKRTNNSDDLDSVELEDEGFASSSGTTKRRGLSKQTVLSGDYKEYIALPLNTDVVYYPGAFEGRMAIDIFTRSDLGGTNREFVPGVGLFITQKGKPTKVVGGISFAYDDGKARIGLVGGFHF